MSNKLFIMGLMLLMFTGVFAVSNPYAPDCSLPTFNTVVGKYNFVDGIGSTLNPTIASNASLVIGEPYKTNLGLTGFTPVINIHGQVAAVPSYRALAILASKDTGSGEFRAIFQASADDGSINSIYVVPNLFLSSTGPSDGEAMYCNGQECVFFMSNSSGYTAAAKVLNHTFTGLDVYFMYVGNITIGVDNGTFYADSDVGAGYTGGTRILTTKGFLNDVRTGWSNGIIGNWIIPAPELDRNYRIDYFGCGDISGSKTVVAWEGSETCKVHEPLPQLNCTFALVGSTDQEICTLPAGSSNTVNRTVSQPSYRDAETSGLYQVLKPPIDYGGGCMNSDNEDEGIVIQKLITAPKETNFIFAEEADSWLDDLLENELITGDRVQSMWRFNVLRHNSPTGSVTDIPLASVNFLTTPFLSGLSCDNENPNTFNVTLLMGINESYFRRTIFECNLGIASTTTNVFGDNLTLLLNNNSASNIKSCANQLVENHLEPVWKDGTSNTINRFAYVELDTSGSQILNFPPSNSFITDDDTWELNYTVTISDVQSCTLGDNAFGTYTYNCPIPNSSYFSSATLSGVFELNVSSPTFVKTIEFQRRRNVSLNITISQDGMPLDGIICASSKGTDVSDQGLCSISLGTTINENVSVTFPNLPEFPGQTITFPIDDYYNSQGFGNGRTCIDFDGTYAYSFDVRDVQRQITIKARSSQGKPLKGVTMFLDGNINGNNTEDVGGDPVCVTTESGSCVFPFELDFQLHSIVGIKDGYFPAFTQAILAEQQEIVLTLNARVDVFEQGEVTGSRGVLDIFTNKIVMGFLVLIGIMMGGISMGGAIGGIAMGLIGTVMLAFMGWIPDYVVIFLVIVLSFLGATVLRDKTGGVVSGGIA